MKDRPQSSVYVPPHQRLRSVITVPPANNNGTPSPSPSPARDTNYQSPFSNPNPNFEGRVSSIPKQQNNNHGGGHFQFSQQRNGSPRSNNHHNQQSKQQWKGNLQYSYQHQQQQLSDSRRSPLVVDEVSEEGSDREFGEFEPSVYPAGFQCASTADNLDHWKWKLSMLLRDKDKQELISREKKDRRDYEQIAALANKMGLYSHSYTKVVVFSKVPLPNYRFDLDEKRPQREVAVDFGLQRRVDAYLADYVSRKSKSANALQDNGFSRSSSSGSIATDEGLFEQPEPLNYSSSAMERISKRRNLQLREQQLSWNALKAGDCWSSAEASLLIKKERHL